MARAVVTGGRGFVGSHLVEHLLKNTDWDIVIFDKLGYASLTQDRLSDIEIWESNKDRVSFYSLDLTLPIPVAVDAEVGEVDFILHLAAESHVDRSISDPAWFIRNNVDATTHILDYARRHPELRLFVNFSTDEVYGPAPDGYAFREFEWHRPSNPYAASKSAQEAIGIAYSNTYKVPVITTHTMNIIGERQHFEKFVPKCIRYILDGKQIPIHGTADGESGSRMYLHARNLADALLHIINLGYAGYDEWNIAGVEEISNLDLACKIAAILDKGFKYQIVDFHSERPGHDLRYALDSSKLLNSGYEYPVDFDDSLIKTVLWTVEHQGVWL
jgi:dTDP-glucose 4,6-dehydratase